MSLSSQIRIILGHKVSQKVLEVDQAKVKVIEKLSPPVSVKDVRSFLGYASSIGDSLIISQL